MACFSLHRLHAHVRQSRVRGVRGHIADPRAESARPTPQGAVCVRSLLKRMPWLCGSKLHRERFNTSNKPAPHRQTLGPTHRTAVRVHGISFDFSSAHAIPALTVSDAPPLAVPLQPASQAERADIIPAAAHRTRVRRARQIRLVAERADATCTLHGVGCGGTRFCENTALFVVPWRGRSSRFSSSPRPFSTLRPSCVLTLTAGGEGFNSFRQWAGS